MKKMILCTVASMALVLSCVAPGPVTLPTEGPLMRQIVRVIERHDSYVNGDASLETSRRDDYLAQSEGAQQLMLSMPEGIPANLLAPSLAPVLDRHDAYVQLDLGLDPLDREQYLASTSGLRSLLTAAVWSQP